LCFVSGSLVLVAQRYETITTACLLRKAGKLLWGAMSKI